MQDSLDKRTDRPLTTRERILVGAAAVVAERGLRGSTVQDILKASEISRRTFYQHFPNTEGVMCDLYILKMEDLVEQVMAAAAGQEDPRRKMRAAMDAYIDFQQAGGRLLIRLQTEAVRPDSMLSPIREKALDRLVALLSGEVESLLSLHLSPMLFRSLLMGVEGLMIHLQRKGEFPAEAAEEARAVVGAMVLDAIAGAVMRKTR